jgi:NADH-quinone oxidoreductase subunit L
VGVEAWLSRLVAFGPAWPALGALSLGVLLFLGAPPTERRTGRIATASLVGSLASSFAAIVLLARRGAPVDLRFGRWYAAGEYGFELAFFVDFAAAAMSALVALLVLATCKFSIHYLHREPGFVRFFALVLAFASGMQLLVLGGSFDLLFAGWEIVGITSVLLVAFFHERTGPVNAAVRVLVTYRLCDVGLLLAALWLHQARHTTVFADLFSPRAAHGQTGVGAAVGLAILFAAMGKSAQFPVGGWLPRAMEGPTASSAVFYGGLSVHAGVYLLVRSYPLFEGEMLVRAAIVLVGAVTAVMGALSGQVAADAKASLAHATVSQVGMMFVEIGLGFPRLAILHLCAHAILRYYQFLRTPSTLQDALSRRSALGRTVADEQARRWEGLGVGLRRFIYRLAIERFEVEAVLERWIVRPALKASRALDALEVRLVEGSHDEETRPPREAGSDAPPNPREPERTQEA